MTIQVFDVETGEHVEREHTAIEKAQLKKDAHLADAFKATARARQDAIDVLRASTDPAHKALLTLLGHDQEPPTPSRPPDG